MRNPPAMALYRMFFTIPVRWMAVIRVLHTFLFYTLTHVEIHLYLMLCLLIWFMTVSALAFRKRKLKKREVK